jgi:hypothetical protein
VSARSRARRIVPLALLLLACSPEASRRRDGGAGADPGNKELVDAPAANPVAADTTLWPGRAAAPVERLARGAMPPPAGVAASAPPGAQGAAPERPDPPTTKAEERSFDRGTGANPRRPSTRPDTSPRTPPRTPPRD